MNRFTDQKSPHLLADPDVFIEFYESLHVQIFRFMLTRLSFDRAAAEDLTADTFLRAWRKRTSYSGPPEKVKYWLFRIARNLLIDFHRKKCPGELDETLERTLVGEHLRDRHVIDREFAETMWRILHRLPIEKQEILIYRYVLGWPVKDIATHLEIKENTASKQIQRALQSIRDRWPEELPGE